MSGIRFYPERNGSYEELMSYYPHYYHGIAEMEALLRYFGGVCDDIETQTEQAYLNNFVLEANEDTIKSWEEMLHIAYTEQLSLDQRRIVVQGRISGNGHIGEPEIRAIISTYTNKPVTVNFEQGTITVVIAGGIFGEDNLLDTLMQRIPAHLKLRLSAEIRQTYHQSCTTTGGLFCYTRITSKLIE